MKTQNDPKLMEWSKSNRKRKDSNDTSLPQETIKYQMNSLILQLKQLKKDGQTKPKIIEGKKS